MSKTGKVKILNPLPGGGEFTSRKSADSFVRRGMAEYMADGSMRFLAGNQSKRSSEQQRREEALIPRASKRVWTPAPSLQIGPASAKRTIAEVSRIYGDSLKLVIPCDPNLASVESPHTGYEGGEDVRHYSLLDAIKANRERIRLAAANL